MSDLTIANLKEYMDVSEPLSKYLLCIVNAASARGHLKGWYVSQHAFESMLRHEWVEVSVRTVDHMSNAALLSGTSR